MSKQRKVPPVLGASSVGNTEEIIRERAYRLFEQRGCEHGHDVDDWLQAEVEVKGKKPSRADLIPERHDVAAA